MTSDQDLDDTLPNVEEEAVEDEEDTSSSPPRKNRSLLVLGGCVAVWAAVAIGSGAITHASPTASPNPQEITSASAFTTPAKPAKVAHYAQSRVYRIEDAGLTGAGFLVGPEMLLTSSHVVADKAGNANSSTVTVTDSRHHTMVGRVAMVDTALDLALVRIPKQKQDPLPFDRSRTLHPGSPVTIIGYPLAMDQSVSTGVVSAVDQSTYLRERNGQAGLLQIDAAVNPGNSGGPVLDSTGHVVGIVTFRPDTSGGRPVEGISFAVPSEDIAISLDQYRKHGDVKYGYLGVTLRGDDRDGQEGAEVASVQSGTPAKAAGLQAGDRLVSVGKEKTSSYVQFTRAMHAYRPGDTVHIGVERDGVTSNVTVTLVSQQPEGD